MEKPVIEITVTHTLTATQIKAKELIEFKGMLQKDVAKKVKVSERTIGSWIKKFKWTINTELERKRKAAKELVLNGGFTQKEAAKHLEVSEKTVSDWAKKDLWKLGIKFIYPNKQQRRYVLTTFIKLIAESRPDLKDVLEAFADEYNNKLEHKKT